MKHVILIHSNPQPWGHPTADYLPEQQALPREEREAGGRAFDEGFAEVLARGELVHAEALGAPSAARLLRWKDGEKVASDGPYVGSDDRSGEGEGENAGTGAGAQHLAGFFVVETETFERAEEIANLFGARGETVELRPVMGDGPDES